MENKINFCRNIWPLVLRNFILNIFYISLFLIFKGSNIGILIMVLIFINGACASYKFVRERNLHAFFTKFCTAMLSVTFIFYPFFLNDKINHFRFMLEYKIRRQEFEKDVTFAKSKSENTHSLQWRSLNGGWSPIFIYSETDFPLNKWLNYLGCNGQFEKLEGNFYAFPNDC